MKLTINGFPKCGSHLLQKAVALLGQDSELVHQPYPHTFEGKHLCIFRHPRNVLISYVRYINMSVSTGTLLLAMDTFNEVGPGFVKGYENFLPWLNDPNTKCFRFEEMQKDDTAIRSIAGYLEVPYLEDAYPIFAVPGTTYTWSGRLSDWKEHWNPTIQEKWVACGGQALQKKLEYV